MPTLSAIRPNEPDRDRYAWFFRSAVFTILAIYMVNWFTPLRLEFDSIRYFGIKDCLEYGCPPDSKAAKDFLPYGYPLLLVGLSKLGILRSFSLVFINSLYLFCSLYFLRRIFGATLRPFIFLTVLLLNWVFIKFFTYALSEMQYLFFSTGSIFFFVRYTRERKAWLLASAFVFAGLAFFTRTVGMALLPALVAGLAWMYRLQLRTSFARNLIIGITLALIAGVFVFWKTLGLAHYLAVFSKQSHGGPGPAQLIVEHLKEWGQLFLNMPIGKLSDHLPGGIANGLFITAGILSLGWFLYSFFLQRRSIPTAVSVYLVLYFLIILNWPFFDPRFWVPVLPFIAAILLQASMPFASREQQPTSRFLPGWARTLRPLMLGIYLLAGVAALGFSLFTQFSKKELARSQAKGIFRNEYETHFFGRPLTDSNRIIKQDVLHILQRYD